MKTFAQALDLIDDPAAISAYEEYHRAVWPEVLAALREIGIERMEIFRVGTRMFMYFSAPDDFDPERDFDPAANEIRLSAGVGFQWITAVGPLAFSLAQALNDESGDDTQIFQFSLGQTF